MIKMLFFLISDEVFEKNFEAELRIFFKISALILCDY